MSNAYKNICIILGNTGADAELRQTKSGTAVTNITVAVRERDEAPMWVKVVVWGKLAEFVVREVGKGSQVLVEGSLRPRTWTDAEGINRSEFVVHAENLQVTNWRAPGSQNPTPKAPSAPTPQVQAPPVEVPREQAPKTKTRRSVKRKEAVAA